MSNSAVIIAILLIGTVMVGLLQVEKMVKLAFGSWVVLGVSLSVGVGVEQLIKILGQNSDSKMSGIIEFLGNAQPTMMLVFSGLLLWFFVKYGQIKLDNNEDVIQKMLWAILSMGSLFSLFWLSLSTVGGSLYDRLFKQGDVLMYSTWFPLFVLIIAIFCLIFASKINIKFSVSPSIGE